MVSRHASNNLVFRVFPLKGKCVVLAKNNVEITTALFF